MLFNSITFAVFLLIVFAVYWSLVRLKDGKLWQNVFILAASWVFYGWWDWRFLSLIFLSSMTDFLVGHAMHHSEDKSTRKILLFVSLGINLGVLGVFKYFNFFVETFLDAFSLIGLEIESPALYILLPVGISFYTFQTLSYTIDIYRRKIEATDDMVAFFAFVSFFPQLVAGPIERASHLLPQFFQDRQFDYAQSVRGLRLILWGLFKKVIIADLLAEYVNLVYGLPEEFAALDVFIATVFFAIQIYCDFSGYSDVAIGTARLFGFDLNLNFKAPYFSATLKEFWERWHISLSTWFRDYVYIPLGGNRVTPDMWAVNIMVVFLVSGLWHGAELSFVIWGGIHGLWFIIEHFSGMRKNVPPFLTHIWTLGIVLLAWIFFRAANNSEALTIFGKLFDWSQGSRMFTEFGSGLDQFMSLGWELLYLSFTIVFLFVMDGFQGKKDINAVFDAMPRFARWTLYYVLIAWFVMFGDYSIPEQFIYFQF